MAETTTKKSTTSTTKKATTVPKVEANVETTTDPMALVAELMKQIEELKAQINTQPVTPVVVSAPVTDNLGSKKIKLINLMHNPLVLSTEPYGEGRVYEFNGYNDTRLVKFDDLAEIVASYPNTTERGYYYICDKKAVEALGLTEEYAKLNDKNMMDKAISLADDECIALFLGCHRGLQESMAVEIANKLNNKEKVDLNALATIKDETGLDIQQIARDIKAELKKANEE